MTPGNKAAATQGPAFLALLTALVALGPLSTDLYLPSLPALARDFDIAPERAQLTLSSFLAGFAAAILFYGPLADRYGRRPVLLGGLAVYTVASAAMVFARDIDWLIALRFLQAVGSCAAAVVCRAMVRDVYGAEGAACRT
jgi:DHA1 family bicyclomycin/chloramphenicol resistance-like MFS transporter